MTFFKILDTRTGLFSTGGYGPGWSTDGKIYKTLPQLKNALKLYCRGSTSVPILATQKVKAAAKLAARRTVPKEWLVVEFTVKPGKKMKAHSLI